MPLNNGEVFAGYVIQRLLGTGGMGEVYLAQHPRLPRQDALKILSSASDGRRGVSSEIQSRGRIGGDAVAPPYRPGSRSWRIQWPTLDLDGLRGRH